MRTRALAALVAMICCDEMGYGDLGRFGAKG